MFTLFSRKASASCLAPLAPIPFPPRLSVVSVYESKVKIWMRKIRRKRCSPCFREKHQPVVWLLYPRFHCERGWVWWVSTREKWRYEGERLGEKDVHLVFAKSISQLFGSFSADFIVSKVECGECLRELSEDTKEKDSEKKMFTLFSRKASASCLTPSAPISFSARLSVVSVYERKVKIWRRKIRRKRCSPCFHGKHQPVVWLLHSRFHFFWARVWWVSMREKWRYERERLGEKDVHLVFSESISQLFGSFIPDSISAEVECGECLWEKSEDMNEKD
jgi:hypothetical protein